MNQKPDMYLSNYNLLINSNILYQMNLLYFFNNFLRNLPEDLRFQLEDHQTWS